MSRRARELSPSGIYHVMTRGVNKMDLFYDDRDRYRYCEGLDKAKQKFDFALYAYCLMSNHVHLLIKENKTSISVVMQSIGVRYSMYFNAKYRRVGHLFQNRFRSEPIGSENQLLTCARYIHNNPVKAGITSKPEKYFWSSFRTYIGQADESMLDKSLLLGIHGGSAALKKHTEAVSDDSFMEYGEGSEEILKNIEEFLDKEFAIEVRDIQFLKKITRDAVIAALKDNFDVSDRSLAELLTLTKDKIHRA